LEQKGSYCENCGSILIDDAWETVNFHEDGSMTLDSFAAHVCSNQCGFYIRIQQ
jgi:RNase P subunit RPR2